MSKNTSLSPSFKAAINPQNNYKIVTQFNKLTEVEAIVYYFGSSKSSVAQKSDKKNKSKSKSKFLDKEQELKEKNLEVIIESHALAFQKNDLLKSDKNFIHFIGQSGPVWVIFENLKQSQGHNERLDEVSYGFARESMGQVLQQVKQQKLKTLAIYFQNCSVESIEGSIVGFELASYNFLNLFKLDQKKSSQANSNQDQSILNIQLNCSQKLLNQALLNASAVQLARHLVNLPPNVLNPSSIEDVALGLGLSQSTVIEVWNEKKCESENMNLLLATGAGSPHAPRMIHFKYRPGKGSKNKKPIAFVGKGITFDTGGLDIKPSSAMRLMKKDMGGAAAVLALAYWADQSELNQPIDFYLALAENSIDGFSMRPGDVYKSRAGYLVEIDNTDAEGRLVLADVMDVAVKKSAPDKPEILIDVATLTGAIKVALGADVAGLFSNDDSLSEQLQKAGKLSADYNWRMPLIQKYFSGMNSSFADFKNSADGFGGAITAALFLQKFTHDVKWAHLDVYAWNDKASGCLAPGQASGQPVQALIHWLNSL